MSLEFEEPGAASVANELSLRASRPGVALAEQAATNSAESLAEEVASFAQARRNWLVRAGFGVSVYAVIVSVIILASAIAWKGSVGSHVLLPAYAALLAGCAGSGVWLRRGRRNRELKQKVQRLVEMDSTAATGALIDVMAIDDTTTARIAREALTRLAPRWAESDFAALKPEQRKRLRGIVRGVATAYPGDGFTGERFPAERAEFRIAICEALSRVGGREELHALKREAAMLAATPSGIRVRNAARAAVPILEARVAELERPQTLLRGASAPEAQPGELLRAAAGGTGSPQDLLRADTNPSATANQA